MYKLQNSLIDLLYNSIQRLNKNIDKNIIRSSLKYDINKSAFKSCIALKLQINPSEILKNININISKLLFKEITIDNNHIFFFINNITKYRIYDNIFNDVIVNLFGKGSDKKLIINIQYQYKDDDSLSYYREKSYMQALINLYKICGYTVEIANNNLVLSDYVKAYNMLEPYIHESANISYFQGDILICNHVFTQYAKYICNYVIRYLGTNKKNITICAKSYSIKKLKYFDKLLNFKYSILLETEPIIIDNKNSNTLQYKNYDFLNEFKYSCMEHNVNYKYKFNSDTTKLKYILTTYNKINKLIKDIYNLDIINNYWYANNTWRIFKNDEKILNYISQLTNVLNFASKEIKLHILAHYLFKLCHLTKPVIFSTIYILNNYNEMQNIDSKQIKSKLKLLLIIRYTIKFILDIFEIKV